MLCKVITTFRTLYPLAYGLRYPFDRVSRAKANNIESPRNTVGVIARMALEVLLFRSLFRNERVELKGAQKLVYGGNKYLWLGGLAFHWSLLIILLRHSRLFTEPVPTAQEASTGETPSLLSTR